ncbi:phosphotransferase-like protein [Streptomyces sp. NBC_00455]|uniref:phosphotransferase-like protein n=1 Tax=Streptomyces sp. NBC_00455 TaxID=2903654 RepID=UPI002E1C9EA4
MATGTIDDHGPIRTPPAPGGTVIFLNGTSSSGKSSIAAELLPVRPRLTAFRQLRDRMLTPGARNG